jgi:hypothetical protein
MPYNLENILCKKCELSFKPHNKKSVFCSRKCKDSYPRSEESKKKTSDALKKIIHKICGFCKQDFIAEKSILTFCSNKCFRDHKQTDIYKDKLRDGGRLGGRISAQSQGRRSKNEIYFAELCEEYFGKDNIICNQPIFDGWDADVIITSKKMAVLWNGQWHYKQIMKSQSLKQVQARDKIKWDVILKNGYTPFVIKDMGKHNPKFVQQEFATFLLSLIDLTH